MFDAQLQQLLLLQGKNAIGTTLFIYAGHPNSNALQQIRSAVPDGFPLIYLHSTNHTLEQPDPLTLLLPDDSHCLERLTLAVHCLKPRAAQVAAAPEWNDSALISHIKSTLRETIHGIYQEKISRLLNLHCAIANLPRLAAQQGTALEVPPNTVALICGAGPSLQSQIEIIRQAQNKVYLIAVGKLAPILLRQGIVPDCIVYVDSTANNIDWKPVFATAKPLLVTLTTSSPEVAAAAEQIVFGIGPSVFFNRAMTEWGLHAEPLDYAATATVTALDFAIRAGFPSIALTGNDLCLADDGATHLPHYGGDELLKQKTETVDGNLGPVTTTPELLKLKTAIENYLSVQTASSHVYNCTAGGAVIAGTAALPLPDFIAALKYPLPTVKIKLPTPAKNTWKWNPWLDAAAKEHAAHLALEQPLHTGLPLSSEQLHLQTELCAEFVEDIKARLDAANSGVVTPEDVFPGFRRLALAGIRKSDQAFADWLQNNPVANTGRFEMQCNFNENACITIKTGNEKRLLTGGYLTMAEDADAEIKTFLDRCKFDESRNALIIVAPASYLHAISAAERYPALKLMVIEPWPELLGQLIDRCLFWHRLPADATIIGASTELPDWRRLCQNHLREWKHQNVQPRLFVNPQAKGLNEVESIIAKLQKMLPSD